MLCEGNTGKAAVRRVINEDGRELCGREPYEGSENEKFMGSVIMQEGKSMGQAHLYINVVIGYSQGLAKCCRDKPIEIVK